MQITIGYLAGVFSQADLKKAPSLEEMLDDKPKASQPTPKPGSRFSTECRAAPSRKPKSWRPEMTARRIADLHGAFTWDLEDFERGTDRIEIGLNGLIKQAREMSQRLGNIGRDLTLGLTVPIGGAVTAIGVMARTSSENLLSMRNSAKLAGEDIEAFQRQAHAAAEEVNIEVDKLGQIFADSREKIGEFAATGSGELKDFFENIAPRVGLTAEAFKDLSGKDGLQLYYDALIQAGAAEQEVEFYMEAIASDARDLIPLLAENGKKFDELGQKAVVFTPDQIEALLKYREAMREIGFAMQRVVIAAVESGLIDLLVRIAKTIADWVTRLAETNPALLRCAGGVALVVAAIGPLIMVLQASAVVVLPLFLARLGPVWPKPEMEQ